MPKPAHAGRSTILVYAEKVTAFLPATGISAVVPSLFGNDSYFGAATRAAGSVMAAGGSPLTLGPTIIQFANPPSKPLLERNTAYACTYYGNDFGGRNSVLR